MTIEYETLIADMRSSHSLDELRAASFIPRLQAYNLPIATAWRIAIALLHPERECNELEQWWTTYAYRELTIRRGLMVWSIVPTSAISEIQRHKIRIVAYFVTWNPKEDSTCMRVFYTYIPFDMLSRMPQDCDLEPAQYIERV